MRLAEVHAALFDPSVSSSVPQLSTTGPSASKKSLQVPTTCATTFTLQLAILSRCAFRVVHALALHRNTRHIVVFTTFIRSIFGIHEQPKTTRHFDRHAVARAITCAVACLAFPSKQTIELTNSSDSSYITKWLSTKIQLCSIFGGLVQWSSLCQTATSLSFSIVSLTITSAASGETATNTTSFA